MMVRVKTPTPPLPTQSFIKERKRKERPSFLILWQITKTRKKKWKKKNVKQSERKKGRKEKWRMLDGRNSASISANLKLAGKEKSTEKKAQKKKKIHGNCQWRRDGISVGSEQRSNWNIIALFVRVAAGHSIQRTQKECHGKTKLAKSTQKKKTRKKMNWNKTNNAISVRVLVCVHQRSPLCFIRHHQHENVEKKSIWVRNKQHKREEIRRKKGGNALKKKAKERKETANLSNEYPSATHPQSPQVHYEQKTKRKESKY